MRALLLAICLASPDSSAQRYLDADRQLVEQASLVASSERIAIYERGIAVQPAFLRLGPKIRIYVAMRGGNATYAHEMAHLFTWRYTSHTLREGIADYLALEIHPGAADLGAVVPDEISVLVARGGMATFLKLYDSSEPEAEFARLYGADRLELVRMASM